MPCQELKPFHKLITIMIMLYWLPILPYCVSTGATFSAAPNTNLTVRTPIRMEYSKE